MITVDTEHLAIRLMKVQWELGDMRYVCVYHLL